MFPGYLHCPKCKYKTRHFLWVHHPFREHDVVFQHQETFALRIESFPDDQVFDSKDDAAVDAYFYRLEQENAKSGEKMIFLPLVKDGPTELPCPQCRDTLHWHITGIA